MIQHVHSGAYEYLWFEHKYSILAVSFKAYQNTGGKLGKDPQIISFLRSLAYYSKCAEADSYSSVLNTYNHIKSQLSRKEKFEIISSLLDDIENARELIYSKVLRYHEKSLLGCRVFFERGFALYKYWDKDERPGLWLCFGGFQLHLPTGFVILRVAINCKMTIDDVLKYLLKLSEGIEVKTFNNWPINFTNYLKQNNMVVLPGKTARLHPRIMLDDISCDKVLASNHIVAALIQEKVWDRTKESKLEFPNLLDYQNFAKEFSAEQFPYLVWSDSLNSKTAYEFLIKAYNK